MSLKTNPRQPSEKKPFKIFEPNEDRFFPRKDVNVNTPDSMRECLLEFNGNAYHVKVVDVAILGAGITYEDKLIPDIGVGSEIEFTFVMENYPKCKVQAMVMNMHEDLHGTHQTKLGIEITKGDLHKWKSIVTTME